jgi:hypothetical protein
MPGCFSSIFSSSSKGSRVEGSSVTNLLSKGSREEKVNGDPSTACYCIPMNDASVNGVQYGFGKDKPPAYTPHLENDLFRPEVLEYIEERVDTYDKELRALSLNISGK